LLGNAQHLVEGKAKKRADKAKADALGLAEARLPRAPAEKGRLAGCAPEEVESENAART
jgi:hypothetical protein